MRVQADLGNPVQGRGLPNTEDTVMAKRQILDELLEGVTAMKSHREGELTLRTYKVELAPLPKVDPKMIKNTRKKLRCSQAVFARKLRINERTLEKWEQAVRDRIVKQLR